MLPTFRIATNKNPGRKVAGRPFECNNFDHRSTQLWAAASAFRSVRVPPSRHVIGRLPALLTLLRGILRNGDFIMIRTTTPRTGRTVTWVLAAVVSLCQQHPISAADARPNILLILADDLGWSDLSCYGNTVFETPHLDRLATEGLRLTQGYSPAPICSASRAGILTGKTPARLGFEFVTKNEPGYQPLQAPLQAPPFTLELPLSEKTIAEVLRDAGYQTAFFGKWHLNRHYKRYLGWSPTHGPEAQGFEIAEEDFGSHPYSYWNEKRERRFVSMPPGEFPVDTMTQRAAEFLRASREQPFFLMVSHFFVHTPVQTRVRWLYDHYLKKIPPDHSRREALAHYAAMVTTIDHLVGETLEALDEAGLTESTLVVFTSDNGGHPEYAGNAPLRGSKWNLYEGGIRVPFIFRWPGRIPKGTVSDAVVSGIDLLPTFSAIADGTTPDSIDGQSIQSLLQNPPAGIPERSLLWHFPYYHPERNFDKAPARIGINDGVTSQTRPHAVLRTGSWKLIHFFEDDREELYHLPTDRAEQTNRQQSDRTARKQLSQTLREHLQQSHARLPTARPAED